VIAGIFQVEERHLANYDEKVLSIIVTRNY